MKRLCATLIAALSLYSWACQSVPQSSDSAALKDHVSESACAGLQVHIQARTATIAPDLSLYQGGQKFPAALKGPSPAGNPHAYRSVSIDPERPSLRYILSPCTSACDNPSSSIYMQKVHHHILYKLDRSLHIHFGERRYVGLSFMVDAEPPQGENILFQVWQGSPFTPPFAAVLTSPDGVQTDLKFVVRNGETGSKPSAVPVEIGRITTLQQRHWYHLIFAFAPAFQANQRPADGSTLSAWIAPAATENYAKVAESDALWGFDPEDSCHYAGHCDLPQKPNPTLDFKLGLYRKGEDSRAILHVEDIRVGTTFAGVDPGHTCSH